MNFLQKNKTLVFALFLSFILFIVWNTLSKTVTTSKNLSLVAPMMGRSLSSTETKESISMGMGGIAQDMMYEDSYSAPISVEPAPVPGSNRLVIQNSSLSLLVHDVTQAKDEILGYVTQIGGYMVSASTTRPEDAPTATIVVRVPSAMIETVLQQFRETGVKVISEQLNGRDVTDQFVDVERRIEQIEQSRTKMEEILENATEISDIVSINNQILQLQNQIDSLKGQQIALQQNAEFAKISVYLSTDELALPYAPDQPFRPQVIFKLAVRSLLTTLHQIASVIIWIAVYAVLWLPLLIGAFFLYRFFAKKTK